MSGINSLATYLQDLTNPQDWRSLVRPGAKESEAGAAPAQNAAPPTPSAALQAGSSVMSGNFASADRSSSRYVKATIAGFGQKTLQELSQNENLFGLFTEVAAFAKSYRATEIERIVAKSRNKKLYAEVEKTAEELKAEVERKAAEAAAPKDANGEPILIGPEAAEPPAADTPLPAPDAAPISAQTAEPDAPPLPGSAAQAYAAASVPLTGGKINITV